MSPFGWLTIGLVILFLYILIESLWHKYWNVKIEITKYEIDKKFQEELDKRKDQAP